MTNVLILRPGAWRAGACIAFAVRAVTIRQYVKVGAESYFDRVRGENALRWKHFRFLAVRQETGAGENCLRCPSIRAPALGTATTIRVVHCPVR